MPWPCCEHVNLMAFKWAEAMTISAFACVFCHHFCGSQSIACLARLPTCRQSLDQSSKVLFQQQAKKTSSEAHTIEREKKKTEEKKIRHHHHNHIADDRRRRQSWSQWRRSSTIHSYDEAVSWFSKCCLVDFQWEFHCDRRRPILSLLLFTFFLLFSFFFLSFSSLLFSQNCIWA